MLERMGVKEDCMLFGFDAFSKLGVWLIFGSFGAFGGSFIFLLQENHVIFPFFSLLFSSLGGASWSDEGAVLGRFLQ